MKNINTPQMELLIELNKSHSSKKVTVPMIHGRTNQFFRCNRDLLELTIHPKTHAVDFDVIAERDLLRRFEIDNKTEMEVFESFMRTIEHNRRLPKTIQTTSLKDIMSDGSKVIIDCGDGTVTRILGANYGVSDHTYWENTMKGIFVTDESYSVMRKQLMLFAFTNFETLPQIIFTGVRGIGKNVYTEMLKSVFVAGSINLDEDIIESSYNSWMKNVLIIADEAMPKTLKTYKLLKSLGNHDVKAINEKYMLPEMYRTNATIIITSNDDIPMYTKASELATNSKNNQFYVYASPVKPRTSFDTKMVEKIKACTVAYVREVLAPEFELFKQTPEYSECRYHMDVPISVAQRELFDSNETESELFIDDLKNSIDNDIAMPFISTHLRADGTGYFIATDDIIDHYCDSKIDKIKLAKHLRKSSNFKKMSKFYNNKTYRGYHYSV